MDKNISKKTYIKPELKKHEKLREITMVSHGRGSCSVCKNTKPKD